jgi:hypothetical protein
MALTYRKRRALLVLVLLILFIYVIIINSPKLVVPIQISEKTQTNNSPALQALDTLLVKGRAPKTNYSREKFGAGWITTKGCDTRNIILNRDLINAVVDANCDVISGVLNDPYTGKQILFVRGSDTSGAIQIDHVVALSDAWQKGAQQLTPEVRVAFANDPLELLAVDGPSNQQKSDGDAATWLPSNKPFRCQYVARQIAIKQKYSLWLTESEHDAMKTILSKCPNQMLPSQ